MYERTCLGATGGSYQQAHLAAAPVVVIMNAPNYAALLGFAQGNLTEISSYDRSGGKAKEKEPQRTKFNPAFQFAPPRDDAPTFRLTASLPLITVSYSLSVLLCPINTNSKRSLACRSSHQTSCTSFIQ